MNKQERCREYLTAVHQLRKDNKTVPLQLDLLKDLALSFDDELFKCEDLTSIKMRLEKLCQCHLEKLFAHLPLETCHSIATTNAADFARCSSSDTRQFVYGMLLC